MTTTVRILALSLLATIGAADPANVAGKWNVTLQLETITGHPVILLKQDGEKLTGTYEGRYGQSDLKGSIKEKDIEFSVTFVAEGMQTQGVFAGKVNGDTMGGDVAYEGAGGGTWPGGRGQPYPPSTIHYGTAHIRTRRNRTAVRAHFCDRATKP